MACERQASLRSRRTESIACSTETLKAGILRSWRWSIVFAASAASMNTAPLGSLTSIDMCPGECPGVNHKRIVPSPNRS